MIKSEGKIQTEKGGVVVTKVEPVASPTKKTGELMAQVEVGAGMTIPLQQYANAKVWVQITLPCAVSEIDDVYSFAESWVEERVQANAAALKE